MGMADIPSGTEPRKDNSGAVARLGMCFVLLITVVWSVGLLRFIDSIPRVEPVEETKADAIVVLTGGTQRLVAGFRLLREGRGGKLFVSGVNENVRPSDLHALAEEDETTKPSDVPRCCVELGFRAKDTRGNAAEIAHWARGSNVRSLIMVTSNYHMPRALLELRATLPKIEIRPHPVVAQTVMLRDWWRWPGSLALLMGEYHKVLLTGFRVLIQAGT
jgi:uncharacterized SAM-binding protein YcdF (DUF218 family)